MEIEQRLYAKMLDMLWLFKAKLEEQTDEDMDKALHHELELTILEAEKVEAK